MSNLERESQQEGELNVKERQWIILEADLCRRQLKELQGDLIDFHNCVHSSQPKKRIPASELGVCYERLLDCGFQEVERLDKETKQKPIKEIRRQIDDNLFFAAYAMREGFYDLSIMPFALAAQMQASIGDNHSIALKRTKETIKKVRHLSLFSPREEIKFVFGENQLFEEAFVLGIEKLILQKTGITSSKIINKVIDAILQNPAEQTTLLTDYMMIISPAEQFDFIQSLIEKANSQSSFTLICQALIKSGYLTEKVNSYLADQANMSFLERLFSKHFQRANKLIEVMSRLKDFQPANCSNEIFQVLTKVEQISSEENLFNKEELLLFLLNYLRKNNLSDLDKEIAKFYKKHLKDVVKKEGTTGLIRILDSKPSSFILSFINTEQLIKGVLFEVVNGEYQKRDVHKFTEWIAGMERQGKQEELSRIVHNLGGKEGEEANNKVQAFLLNLFILPACRALPVSPKNKIDRELLAAAGKTIISVLSEKKTDVGRQFYQQIKAVEEAVFEACALNPDREGFSTEIEVYYLDNQFEFITLIKKDINTAFAIPQAYLNLNESLKEAGLLWPLTGHSIHTHVSLIEQDVVGSSKVTFKDYFRELVVSCRLLIDPVDRLEYMIKFRYEKLVDFDFVLASHFKLQNRLNTILDRDSLELSKDLALYAKKVFIDNPNNIGFKINNKIKQIDLAVISYLQEEASAQPKLSNEEDTNLKQIIDIYLNYVEKRFGYSEIIKCLANHLKRVESLESCLEKELKELYDSAQTGKQISVKKLQKKKTELEEVRKGRIKQDYFFLLGKKRRDELAKLIRAQFLEFRHFSDF